MKFAEYLKKVVKVVKEETKAYVADVKVRIKDKQLENLKAKAEKQGFSLVENPTQKEGK